MIENDREACRAVATKMLEEARSVLEWDGQSSIQLTNPLKVAGIQNGVIVESMHESALSGSGVYYDTVRELQSLHVCCRNMLDMEPDWLGAFKQQIKRVETLIEQL